MGSFLKRTAVVCALVAGLSVSVSAVTVSAEEKGMKPCAGDIATFCKGVKPGEGRIEACLKEHQNDLSGACKDHIAKIAAKGSDVATSCRGDIAKYCKEVKPGGGRMLLCLKEHAADLSAECKEALTQGKH